MMQAARTAASRVMRAEMTSQTGRPTPPDPSGQAMWRAAERRGATLYRRAVEGMARLEDPVVEEALQRVGGGQALPADVRRAMERALGVPLDRVRVHTDAMAADAARAVCAEAFTVGEDIFFAEHAFAPETERGAKLLAHELTHVVQAWQQRTSTGDRGDRVSEPDEHLEHEAHAAAERLGKPDREPGPHIRASAPPPSADVVDDDIGAAAAAGVSGAGGSLPHLDAIQRAFGPAHDLLGVRAHVGGDATAACDAIGAQAYATGGRVAFREQPDLHTAAHEAAHLVQQASGVRLANTVGEAGDGYEHHADAVADRVVRGESAADLLRGHGAAGAGSLPQAARTVQRKIKPEDVSSEMIGRMFELSDAFTRGSTTLPRGARVKVVAWDNAKSSASVEVPPPAIGPALRLDVPKKILRPANAAVKGMNAYSAGVDAQADAVDAAEDKLADWAAREAEYKKAGTTKLWDKEKARLEDLLQKKTETLNRKLIQETMFNRFDGVIKREVDAANAAAGFKGTDALDPNLLKSMLFEESQLGTAGHHLEEPPSHPVKSRFNLGQVIDSSAMALLTMLEKEQPAVITKFKLGTLRADLATAQQRREALQKKQQKQKGKLTAPERAELAELDKKSKQSWEGFIWGYRATGSAVGFWDAIREVFAKVPAGSPEKNLDYEFWIHMAVLWLFEKHKKGMSWPATIRAYNGGGKRADHYRDAVTRRAADAAKAAKHGKDFTPGGI